MNYSPLPPEYVTQYIYQYVGYVKHHQSRNRYQGGCPFCREGKSWGRKARFWYNPEEDFCHCYNCGYVSNARVFIHKISGLSYKEIEKESKDYDIIPFDLSNEPEELIKPESKNTNSLPYGSFSLLKKQELMYYKDVDVVKAAVRYLIERNLDKAVNKPNNFYFSLKDFVHKNRLVIPYYYNGNVVWYQSRKIVEDDSEKYLSKSDSEKSLYNMDCVDENIPCLFVTEGAIDAMFIRNGTCVSGINEKSKTLFTDFQKEQLGKFPFYQVVWVLDSPYLDDAAKKKQEILLDMKQKVFKWPSDIGKKYKDINALCVDMGLYEFPYKFILNNLFKGDFFEKVQSLLRRNQM